MALIDIKVPDIGDFAEVSVIELLVKAGDTVKPEQSLITVESDKASMEIPSSAGGVVKELKVKIGDKVAEGSVLLSLDTGAAAAPVSSDSTTEPSATLSPILTLISFTTPAWLDGISMDALSDSTVISDWSALTLSPGLTNNSMMVTSSKSPISGTCISTNAMF